MTIIDQTQIWENKCHWGRLHGGSTLCRLSQTTPLLAAITHTHTHTSRLLCSHSALSALIRAVHSQQRNRIVHRAFFAPCIPNVNILYISTLEMEEEEEEEKEEDEEEKSAGTTPQIADGSGMLFWCRTTGEWLWEGFVIFFHNIFRPLCWFFFFLPTHNHRQVRCLSG